MGKYTMNIRHHALNQSLDLVIETNHVTSDLLICRTTKTLSAPIPRTENYRASNQIYNYLS